MARTVTISNSNLVNISYNYSLIKTLQTRAADTINTKAETIPGSVADTIAPKKRQSVKKKSPPS